MARDEERTTQVRELDQADETTATRDFPVEPGLNDGLNTAVDSVAAVDHSDLDADTVDELRVTIGGHPDDGRVTDAVPPTDMDMFPDELDEHGDGPTSVHHARKSDAFERFNLPLTPDEFEETGVVEVDDAPSRSADLDDDDSEEIVIDDDPYVLQYNKQAVGQGAGSAKIWIALVGATLALALIYLLVR